jgi:hypothetical protein
MLMTKNSYKILCFIKKSILFIKDYPILSIFMFLYFLYGVIPLVNLKDWSFLFASLTTILLGLGILAFALPMIAILLAHIPIRNKRLYSIFHSTIIQILLAVFVIIYVKQAYDYLNLFVSNNNSITIIQVYFLTIIAVFIPWIRRNNTFITIGWFSFMILGLAASFEHAVIMHANYPFFKIIPLFLIPPSIYNIFNKKYGINAN